jgi:hypothetical protein
VKTVNRDQSEENPDHKDGDRRGRKKAGDEFLLLPFSPSHRALQGQIDGKRIFDWFGPKRAAKPRISHGLDPREGEQAAGQDRSRPLVRALDQLAA